MRFAIKGGEHKLFCKAKLFKLLVRKPLQNFLTVDSVSENFGIILRNSYEFKNCFKFFILIMGVSVGQTGYHNSSPRFS